LAVLPARSWAVSLRQPAVARATPSVPQHLLSVDRKHNASAATDAKASVASNMSAARQTPTLHTVTSEQVVTAVFSGKEATMNKFAVNFGAGDGVCMIPGGCSQADALGHGDPVYALYTKWGFGGLAVEGNPQLLPALSFNLPAVNISKIASFVTPMNTVQLLQAAHAPLDMDYFKNDIDAYDCAVLYSVLKAGYRPKILQLEVNPEIPFPINFGVNYSPNFKSNLGNGGFYGCSTTLAANIAMPFGYDIVGVSFTHDVIFVRKDLLPAPGLKSLTILEAVDEEAVCCMAPTGIGHFGQMSNYHVMNQLRPEPQKMLAAFTPVVAQSCQFSQGTTPNCLVPYTVSLNAVDFITQYEQTIAANGR